MPDLVKDLIKGMLKVEENERMSWEDVFNHPLIKDPNPFYNITFI